jgi:hypothetical protein
MARGAEATRTHEYRKKMKPRIHAAALALASDSTIVVNVAHLFNTQDARRLLQLSTELGGELFIGVTLTQREAKEAAGWLEGAAAEVVGHVGGRRLRKQRRAR